MKNDFGLTRKNLNLGSKTKNEIMKNAVVFLLLLLIVGCTSFHHSKYWPYSKVPPNKLYSLYPIEYEDCMPILDSILTNEVIDYFKHSDSSIAAAEISDGIGGFFTTNWRLYQYGASATNPYHTKKLKLPKSPVDLASRFTHDGIDDTRLMVRIMFNCYHKYLNGQSYSWNQEIEKMKPYSNNLKALNKLDSQKMEDYRFSLLNQGDTVDIVYNRPPKFTKKSSDWYYLTGIILHKFQETKEIELELIHIRSAFDEGYYLVENDTIRIGDTLIDYSRDWLKRGHYYFRYNNNAEYREGLPFVDSVK